MVAYHKMPRLKTRIFPSIQDVPYDIWDSLSSRGSNTFSTLFWKLIEQSELNNFSYRHALFFDDADQPVGLASFYSVTTDIAIFAPRHLRKILAGIRRLYPNFLKLRMLECGTPIILNSPGFLTDGEIPEDVMVEAIDSVLSETCKKEGHLLIIVRDFEEGTEILQSEFSKLGYSLVGGLPNTYMEVVWENVQDYVASMKSYYRSKLQKHLRIVTEQGIRYELVDSLGDFSQDLCNQWLNVHNNAVEFQREILTPKFYSQFSTMNPNAKALLFYRGDEMIGHVLLLMDGDMLRWLYFGRQVPVNDSLYIYAAYKVIETAINLGAKKLEMGLTTYPIKQDLGAKIIPIKFAIKARWRGLNPLVKLIYPLINFIPKITDKEIFKKLSHTGKNA